jgi:hypothetical protein
MAITRTQIARQLYQAGGGADFGAPDKAEERASKGYGNPSGGKAASKGFKQDAPPGGQDPQVYGVTGKQYDPEAALAAAKAKAEAEAKEKRKTIRERINNYNKNYKKKQLQRYQKNIIDQLNAKLAGLKNFDGFYGDTEETYKDFIENYAPSITTFGPKETGGTGKYSQKFIDDVLSGKRKPPESFVPIDIANVPGGFLTKGLAAGANLVGKGMAGPTTMEELMELYSGDKGSYVRARDLDIDDVTSKEMLEEFEPNRFKLLNPEPGGDGPQDPCKGPNPPAYCFVGIRSVEPEIEEYVNPLSKLTPRIAGTQFAADGGRIGFKGGADMGTVSGATRAATAKSVNVSPGGNVTTSKTRGPDGPDDRSSFEQTVNQRNVINRAKTSEPSGLEKLYKTGSELNFFRNLMTGNFPGLAKQLMFDLGKKKFLDDQVMLDTEDDNMQMAELSQKQLNFLNSPKIQRDLKEFGREPKAVFDMLPDYEERPLFSPNQEPTTPEEFNQYLDSIKVPRMKVAGGGIASLDREAFLLGGIAKGLKKAVRGVKKLAKSPIGKAALLGGLAYFGGGGGLPKFLGGKGLGGFSMETLFSKANPLLFTNDKLSLGKLALASAVTPFLFPGEKKNEFDLDAYYAANRLNPNAPLNTRIAGSQFDFYGGVKAADGGRIGYQEGGDAEPVAKKTMPLLDMDGKEKDYRETGGFVDMGRMERADDVPARLSKNEFVFTADAVRNAGEGDIDKGAEVMYNMMKNLEAGGEVSEESQGLEGARNMFQTSQRLGEVI